jgi:3-dehydroquinate dehydratase/shikimate dehydrogenase
LPAAARLVATLTEEPSAALLAGLDGRAEVLEVRADLVGELDPGALRQGFEGELLYTLRSAAEGGQGPDDRQERARRLGAAAASFDLVDLESRDLAAAEEVPAVKRLLSWHGRAESAADLRATFERLTEVEARYFKLVPAVERPGEGLAPLRLLRDLGRDDVVAFAGGPVGAWTRLPAARLGSPLIYTASGETPAAAGQPRLDELCRDYGLPWPPGSIDAAEVVPLYGIVGRPVHHSLSPRLHNGLYRRLGLAGLYLAFEVEQFGDFWLEVVEGDALADLGFDLRGLTVTAPHKEIALAVAGAASPLAEHLGSANTLVRRDGVWEAESTDPDGVRGPLEARGIEIAGRRAAVIGAGGAGRAAAVALRRAGAEVALVNRSSERGVRAAHRLGVAFVALEVFDPAAFGLVVNATPLGGGRDRRMAFDPGRLAAGAVVLDMVYRRGGPTPLVAAARECGLDAVDGREVLLHQAPAQFAAMTGRSMSLAAGAELLGLAVGERAE